MTSAEKYNWASLITTGAIFYYFKMRLLDGWSLADHTAIGLFWIYISVIGLFIVTETIIAAVIALNDKKNDITKDERDHMIARKAARNGGCFIIVVLNIALCSVLAENAFGDQYHGMNINLTSPISLFFHLMSMLIIATLIERISALIYYQVD